MGDAERPLTWNGLRGAFSNADHDLHLLDAAGRSLCNYAPSQLRPATLRDFTPLGEIRGEGRFCDTCRERGMTA